MSIVLKEFKKEKLEGIPEIISDLLNIRKIYTQEELDDYFYPKLGKLSKAENIGELIKIKERILDIKKSGEGIAIYGDYDVDGITSSVILANLFEKLEMKHHIYIPNRFDEGYGISQFGIDEIEKLGFKHIISVDCGITSYEEVEYARSKGIEIIITDHHEVTGKLPNTLIFDPKLYDETYNFHDLAGCGVALFLFMNFFRRVDNLLKKMFALTAIGTIADVVPLRGDNRTIVKLGLDALNTMEIEGIDALKKVSGIDNERISTYHIGFAMGPRLNAGGRLESAQYGVDLLLGKNVQENAKFLNDMNNERKELQNTIFEKAKEMYNEKSAGIILSSQEFNRGVNGIVASKFVEFYHKPAIILEDVDGILHGSGRSIQGIDIMSIIAELKNLLLAGGGHEMACGITLKRENYSEFKDRFNKILLENYSEKLKDRVHYADIVLGMREFSREIEGFLEKMEPFGIGNPKPKFLIENIEIMQDVILLKDKYKKYIAKQSGMRFNMLDWRGKTNFGKNETISVIGFPKFNTFRGVTNVVLEYIVH
ncbi:single-stranded-DNA-specific exonuclease RecJ [bacterium]|nr:single-stranded-DNA-specific exonuclease RecJ [bacterium]